MDRNTEARAELYALVQMTKSVISQTKSAMILCDEDSYAAYRGASAPLINAQKKPYAKPKASSHNASVLKDDPISSHSLKHPQATGVSNCEKAYPSSKKPVVTQPATTLTAQAGTHEEIIEPARMKSDTNRLLPRSFGAAVMDTSAIRDAMSRIKGMPHLSASPMYSGAPKKDRAQWAICTYIAAQESSERGSFIGAVTNAIRERLSIEPTTLACEDSSFAKLFPMVLDDCEVAIFFVDQHLEEKLRESLRVIPSYDPTPHSIAAPFISLGSLHKKPLRAVLLNKGSHEDPLLKQQLWMSIRKLATTDR